MTKEKIQILIENEGIIYQPVIQDSVTWETERKGTPGKLTFSIVNDNYNQSSMKLNIQEGNRVTMRYGEKTVFTGFLFSKKRSKDQIIQITAYDQLRYFKNKFSYDYDGKKASEVLRMIAEDFHLSVGDVEDTKVVLSRREDAQTLFDIILNALDDTVRLSSELFVLYDDFGKLALKNVKNMRLDFIVDKEAAEDFEYTSSIDQDTYNRIILYYDDEEKKERIPYSVEDSYSISQWGVLQMFEKIENPELGDQIAEGFLKLYNSPRRSLSVKGVKGNLQARAGASLPVHLTLGDINANSYLMIEKAKHSFQDGCYTMDLTLRGGMFI